MLGQLKDRVEQVVGKVQLEQKKEDQVLVAEVESPLSEVQLTLAWDQETHYVLGELQCDHSEMPDLIKVCSSFGQDLQCGSVFLSGSLPTKTLENQGYSKQYIYPLNQLSVTPVDFSELDRRADAFADYLRRLLGRRVEVGISLDQRPHIYSLDWKSKGFSLFLHIHPLTQAAYLEEIVIPKTQRHRGLGTRMVDYLKCMLQEINCTYLYLSAKKRAEGFWQEQGFDYLLRANLRNERRRIRALKRAPGWERGYLKGERLPKPNWAYRNHPQDDIDLHRVIKDCPLKGTIPASLTGISG